MRHSQRDAPAAVRYLVLLPLALLFALLFAIPVAWLIVSSIRPQYGIFAYLFPISWRSFIPEHLSLSSFQQLLSGGSYGQAFFNSLITAAAAIVFGLPISALAAFALSAIRFRGQALVMTVVVVTFLIPFDSVAVPLVAPFRDWGLQNTYAGIFLPALGNGLAIFLLRQFFLGIPRELAEAAQVDGAGWFTIFLRVYLPLSPASLVGAGIVLFMFQWNAYLWPLLIAPSAQDQIAPVALVSELGEYQQSYGPLFVGTLLIGVVPAFVLLVLQPFFRRSVSLSGIK